MSSIRDVPWGSSEEAGTILVILRELFTRLGITKTSVRGVKWTEKYRRGTPVPPDRPVFRSDTLFLSVNMRGKLSVEDWRALLAAAIIYDERMRLKRRLGRLVIVSMVILLPIVAFLLSLLIFALLPPFESSYSGGRVAGAVFVLFLVAGLGLIVVPTSPYMRNLVFLGDRMTGMELGLGR